MHASDVHTGEDRWFAPLTTHARVFFHAPARQLLTSARARFALR